MKRPLDPTGVLDELRNRSPRGVIARGLGRSYGDPAQNAGGTVLDMTGFNSVQDIDLSSATVTVGAGMSIHSMLQLFVPLGLFVPVTPGTRYVTVGGAIASDIHGKNHHADGTFGDHVETMRLVTATGNCIDMSRQSHPDLFRATCGGMGLTGIILSATIRMIRIRTSKVLVDTDRVANLDELMDLMAAGDNRYRYSVSWLDTLATGRSFGRGVLYRGNHLADGENDGALSGPTSPRVAIPDFVPGRLVGLTSARIFNDLWYRRHPESERERPQELSAFFHQLDMIADTNRVYGSLGFVQHQSVIPTGEEESLREIVEILSSERVPTYLVVLKRMGPGNGMLSFPIEGWTLAVDIPSSWCGLAELLDRLDEIVAKAGGRLYFAKDSRMRPELVPTMYPELEAWHGVVNRYDPDGVLQSDLSRRLNLRGDRRQ